MGNRNIDRDPHTYGQQGQKQFNEVRNVFSKNDDGTVGWIFI